MYALEIVIEGKTSMPGEQPWLKQELQKLLDLHGPFIGLELKAVKVQAYEVEKGVLARGGRSDIGTSGASLSSPLISPPAL